MKRNGEKLRLRRKYKAEYSNLLVSLIIFILSLCLIFHFSPKISSEVKKGLELCFAVIIPSVFPFTVLSDIMLSFMRFEEIGALRRAFFRIFKINGYALSAFLIGLISGFPIGVKIARELYLSGKISKNECERLIGFSNNAGPAFVISGIGFALLGSAKLGVFLYLVSMLSSVTVGFFSRFFATYEEEKAHQSEISFSFASSIKNATYSTVSICGFISFFSVVTGFISYALKNKNLVALFTSFLEIGNAANFIAKESTLPLPIKLSLLAFAISFSGLSVHMQAKSFLLDTDISMRKYYIMKIFSGSLSAVTVSLTYIIAK